MPGDQQAARVETPAVCAEVERADLCGAVGHGVGREAGGTMASLGAPGREEVQRPPVVRPGHRRDRDRAADLVQAAMPDAMGARAQVDDDDLVGYPLWL